MQGTVVDVATICAGAGSRGVPVLVDGSQAAVHMPINVQEISCDFYAVTGHKLCGPSGSGAIYVRQDRIAEMQPFMDGRDMIGGVTRDRGVCNDAPMKSKAGSQGIVQTIGLEVTPEYIMRLGMANIAAHENRLRDYARMRLRNC